MDDRITATMYAGSWESWWAGPRGDPWSYHVRTTNSVITMTISGDYASVDDFLLTKSAHLKGISY